MQISIKILENNNIIPNYYKRQGSEFLCYYRKAPLIHPRFVGELELSKKCTLHNISFFSMLQKLCLVISISMRHSKILMILQKLYHHEFQCHWVFSYNPQINDLNKHQVDMGKEKMYPQT